MEQAASDSPKEEGIRLLRAGQIDEAIQVLGDVLRADKDDPQAHMYIGVCYGQKNDKLHAIHHLETSVNLEENPKALYNLGMVYESAHRIDEAVRQYRMAVQLDPDYAMAQQALHKLQEQYAAAHIQDSPVEEHIQEEASDHADAEPATDAGAQHRTGGFRNLLRFRRKDGDA
jgi:tetratricopeptide (TPR) repeat protein